MNVQTIINEIASDLVEQGRDPSNCSAWAKAYSYWGDVVNEMGHSRAVEALRSAMHRQGRQANA